MKGYKTIVFNLMMTGIMILRMWNPESELPGEAEITAGVDAIDTAITFVWGVGNLILRAITNTSIFKKE